MIKVLLIRIKRRLKLIYKQLKHLVVSAPYECNICGWHDDQFLSDGWHDQSICPRCESQIRHRLLWATHEFKKLNLFDNQTILHFAPDTFYIKRLTKISKKYITADFLAEGYHYHHIDLNLDISDMKTVSDNSYDTLIALDVLEHVQDDRKALMEVFRVLVPGGKCVLTVPQQDGLEKTKEDKGITSPEDRTKHYGQWDHLRIYGNDFSELMEQAGFKVKIVDHQDFDVDLVTKHILYPLIPSQHPLATNHRKVFIGTRTGK